MTDELRTLLRERADAADLRPPDLPTITASGRHQVRRRRGALAVAGLAAAAVVGGGLAVVTGHGHRAGGHDVATEPDIPTTGLSWVTGSTLHVGSQDFDLGHDVAAYVRTSAGYVFADPRGTVWSAAHGTVTEVGAVAAADPHLVSGGGDSLAGWVDESAARPSFSILDQSTGAVTRSAAAPGTTGASSASSASSDESTAAVFEALDGDTAWWRDAGGQSVSTYVPADGASDRPSVITEPRSTTGQVLAGRRDVTVTAGDGDAITIRQPDGRTTALGQVYATIAELSPDGALVNLDADSPAVYRTVDGSRVDLDVHGYFADGYEWLDDDTLAVLALPTKKSDFELQTCVVSTGSCRVAVPHLAPYDADAADVGFILPIGAPLG